MIRRVGDRGILGSVVAGLVRNSLRDPQRMRCELLKNVWIELKRFSAPRVQSIEISEVLGRGAIVEGGVSRYCPLVLAALGQVLRCRQIFEIGTYRGDTAWLLAHNNPDAHVFTLDLPSLEAARTVRLELTDPEYFLHWERGKRFAGTTEASRITQLYGDSATFDSSPYEGGTDLVYIDASHSYSSVRSDSEAALRMLTVQGTTVWDDYTYYPGIYAYLNELAPHLDRPVVHILGTRLALYCRSPIFDTRT